jgi:hypothetical protein
MVPSSSTGRGVKRGARLGKVMACLSLVASPPVDVGQIEVQRRQECSSPPRVVVFAGTCIGEVRKRLQR